jgi:hypothetical protein
MGCAQLIRNLAIHGTQLDEQIALEQLASLSLLASDPWSLAIVI